MPLYSRYVVLKRLPASLRFRNGIVLLECARDCSREIPTWVFRARKQVPAGRRAAPAPLSPFSAPLPSVSPSALAAATGRAANDDSLIIASSLFGKRHLEGVMQSAIVVPDGSAADRMMKTLVRLGYARLVRTSAREV